MKPKRPTVDEIIVQLNLMYYEPIDIFHVIFSTKENQTPGEDKRPMIIPKSI